MKRIILLLPLLFNMSTLFSQEVFKLGIVKGKHVTYEVKEYESGYAWWTVSNIHNPDTTTRQGPELILNNWRVHLSCELQLGQIVRNHLTQEELLKLSKKNRFCDTFSVKLRIDWQTGKVLQVVWFKFGNLYAAGLHHSPEVRRKRGYYPDHYDGFWLNFDPDRLHEIEQDIVTRLKVPEISEEMQKILERQDLTVLLKCREIPDVEKVIKEKQKREEQNEKEREKIRKENKKWLEQEMKKKDKK